MITTTANFDAKRNAQFQEPVFVLTMPGLGLTYASRGQAQIAATATWMKDPAGVPQQVQDLQGKATIGTISIEILDVNNSLLQKFATFTWYGQPASLLLGFNGLSYPADYITLFAGLVHTVVPTADGTAFTFTLQDKNRTLNNRVFGIGDDGVTPTSKQNPRTVAGNPLAIMQEVLLYELGIASANIDLASITAPQNGRFSATQMLFSLTKPVQALSWIEQELMIPNGLFHFVRADGRIAVGDMLAAPSPAPIAFAFNDGNIVGIPGSAQKQIYNWLEFQFDYDGSGYLQVQDFLDSDSINKYGLSSMLSVRSQGMRSNLQGGSRAGITARRIFQRYAGGPMSQVSLTHASLQACVVEVGDYVTVTHRLMKNLDTGTLGWNNRICQVMEVKPQFSSGTIQFTLLDVNYLASRAAFEYAPDNVPSWPSASSAQRAQYLFQSDANGKQGDGTNAGRIF